MKHLKICSKRNFTAALLLCFLFSGCGDQLEEQNETNAADSGQTEVSVSGNAEEGGKKGMGKGMRPGFQGGKVPEGFEGELPEGFRDKMADGSFGENFEGQLPEGFRENRDGTFLGDGTGKWGRRKPAQEEEETSAQDEQPETP